jgi:hypothetical protein
MKNKTIKLFGIGAGVMFLVLVFAPTTLAGIIEQRQLKTIDRDGHGITSGSNPKPTTQPADPPRHISGGCGGTGGDD